MNEKPTNPNDIVGTTVQKNKNILFKGLDILRSILFIPICFLFMDMVHVVSVPIIDWLYNRDIMWLVILLLFVITFFLYAGLSGLIVFFLSKLSPHIVFRNLAIIILSILSGIRALYVVLSADIEIYYKVTDLFEKKSIFTVIVIYLTGIFINTATLLHDTEDD